MFAFTTIPMTVPALANSAWSLARFAAGSLLVCTGGYYIGRTGARLIQTGAAKASETLNRWETEAVVERHDTARERIYRRKRHLDEAVNAEIDRRIKAGEMSFSPSSNKPDGQKHPDANGPVYHGTTVSG